MRMARFRLAAPPLGPNRFGAAGVRDDPPVGDVRRGGTLFVIADALPIAFLPIVLWLPSQVR